MAHVADVIIDHNQVSADLTDFVVFINLADLPNSFWTTVANGGGDIRVYKSGGTTELAREIVFCDTTAREGEIHVKYAGTLSSTVDTTIEIYADGSSADYAVTATYGRNNVWTEYFAVYHLNDATGGGLVNSTGSGLTLNLELGSDTGDKINGRVGYARDFDGVDSYTATSFNMGAPTALTVSAWSRLDSSAATSPGAIGMMSYGTFTASNQQWPWMLDARSGLLYGYAFKASGVLMEATGTTSIPLYTWNHLALTYTGSNGRMDLWLNGVSDGNATNANVDSLFNTAVDTLYVGRYENSFGDRFFDGAIDEIRIATIARSSHWLLTEKRNQGDTSAFYRVDSFAASTLKALITIDPAQIPSDLTNFIIYVDLSHLPASFWNTVANGGGDIRVFKEGGFEELPRHVVSCDTATDTGEMHIRYTGTLSGTLETVIEVHADGTSPDYSSTSSYGSYAVWSDYSLVALDGGNVDATGTANGTLQGGVSNGGVNGKVGKATDYDGSNDYVVYTDRPNLGLSRFTISQWVKFDVVPSGTSQYLFGNGNFGGGGEYDVFAVNSNFYGRSRITGGDRDVRNTTDIIVANTWYLVHYTYDGSTQRIYTSGVQRATNAFAGTPITGTTAVHIGSRQSPAGNSPLNGQFDFAKIRQGALSADWITAEYNNQNSPATFYTATEAVRIVTLSAINITTTGATIRGELLSMP